MEIALCHPFVVPSRGGCETYIVDLARRLRQDGHQVHLYAWDWDQSVLPTGVICHRLPAPRKIWRPLRPWLFSRVCLKELRHQSHHLSIGFDKTYGQDVLYPQGGLYRATLEGNYLIQPTPWGRWLARVRRSLDLATWSFLMLERKQYLQERPIVLVNSQMVRGHFQHYYGIEGERLRVVPSAIDPGRFPPSARRSLRQLCRSEWGCSDDEPIGLFAATNYPLKGLVPLLHALRHIPVGERFRLVVAGNAQTKQYVNLSRRLKVDDRVAFVGYCADMKKFYFGADFLVHPTFYDPCSLVVLEALACGLPVITSRYNGASELLTPSDAGIVVDDPHNHQQLATALIAMLNPERRGLATWAARQAAARWTFEDHYQRLVELFGELVRTRRAA